MSLKERISSPLEAGTSILDAHHLPPQLTPALEWASTRLAKKSMHVTLVVARRDYQLPAMMPPKGSPGLGTTTTSTPTTPSTPRFHFSAGSALKQMVRYTGPGPDRRCRRRRCGDIEAATTTSSSPRLMMRWPLSPTTPLSPPPPMTPSSTTTADALSPSLFAMRLIYANGLHPKVEKALKTTLNKAEKKFQLGPEWLSPAMSPAACGLTNQLVHSSILQNEVLFASEGLTLLSLARLYSLKSALSSYSKTRSHLRLEDAVDELRRTILANNGAKVFKADILRSYDWLSVSTSALNDLDRMYRRAYGGPDQIGAISGMPKHIHIMDPVLRKECEFQEEEDDSDDDDDDDDAYMRNMTVLSTAQQIHFAPPPQPKVPALKLQTNFATTQKPTRTDVVVSVDDEDEERTARPTNDGQAPATFQKWTNSSIDQILNADLWSPIESAVLPRTGPMTPKGYDDISPTTQGEWGFLMVDSTLQAGRTVAVETC